jgi:hypothetical protein
VRPGLVKEAVLAVGRGQAQEPALRGGQHRADGPGKNGVKPFSMGYLQR